MITFKQVKAMNYNQILMLFLQSTLVAFIILFLFRLRKQFGIGILFACLGLFQFLQVFLLITVRVPIIDGILILPGPSILFIATLFAILIIYIKEEAGETRNLIYALFIINIVMILLIKLFSLNYNITSDTPFYESNNLFDISAGVLFIGTITLFLDSLLIIIIFKFVSKRLRFLFLKICLTMLTVATFDSLVFSTIAFWSSKNLSTIVLSSLISKGIFSLYYSLIFYFYLKFFDIVAKKSYYFKIKEVFKSVTYKQKFESIISEIKKIEKERAADIELANKELLFQNKEKGKRADELALVNIELARQNEEKERRAKELRHFIETANAPIFGINSRGLINEWNQTSEKITGFSKKEVLGEDLVQTYITEDYRESVKKVLDDALLGEETSNFEFPLFTKEGKRIMVLLNLSTGRNAAGDITGALGVGQDITELVSYRNELELKVNERTLKLNEALKKEIELNELKSKFVSTASHEFRTPLSAINFAAGSIKKYWSKMEPIMIEKKLSKIEDQVIYMTALLEDILIAGQLEAGEIRNKPLQLNLGNFIQEIIEEVYSSSEKSHEIELIDTENLKSGDIFIDEKLGRNIFMNLIGNAVKFSPDAKKVTVELSSEKTNTIISITDLGIGISDLELKEIFLPFRRGENVDFIQGTGLGLSIVKDAIDIIGGEIIVNSSLVNGTTFVVKIPKS
jgi:PAS domain S-box-containing protein